MLLARFAFFRCCSWTDIVYLPKSSRMNARQHVTEIVPVSYEFRRSKEMLRIVRRDN